MVNNEISKLISSCYICVCSQELMVSRGEEEEDERSSTTHPVAGFIRIITPTILSEGKMELLDKSVMKLGVGEKASISVASGDIWMVGVERIGNKQVLFNLKEFMQFYGVQPEYLFIFTYNRRDSTFSVVICDPSAAEIPYRRLLQTTSTS